MTAIYFILIFLCVQGRTECKKQKYTLLAHLRSERVILQFVWIHDLEVSWAHLVDEDTMECVVKVELRDHAGDVLDSKGYKSPSKDEEPFVQEYDICKDLSKAFYVTFYLDIGNNKLSPLDSQEVKVSTEQFLNYNKYLPFA